MTDFIVTITDQASLDGITWAREQYNAAIPPPPPPLDTVTEGMAMPEGTLPPVVGAQSATAIDTDEAYVQWVMEQAAISYADQQLRDQYRTAYEDEAMRRKERQGA